MKATFLTIATFFVILFVSCEKENDPEPELTTYRIINNKEKWVNEDGLEYGILWDVVVFCYVGDDIARQDNLEPIHQGDTSEKIEVEPNFEKVKVSFRFFSENQYYNYPLDYPGRRIKYVMSFYFLKEGENTDIIIDEETMYD